MRNAYIYKERAVYRTARLSDKNKYSLLSRYSLDTFFTLSNITSGYIVQWFVIYYTFSNSFHSRTWLIFVFVLCSFHARFSCFRSFSFFGGIDECTIYAWLEIQMGNETGYINVSRFICIF